MNNIPVFDHTKHKELWQWCADHPAMEKYWAPILRSNTPLNNCYACQAIRAFPEYLIQSPGKAPQLNCRLCPLMWPGGECEADTVEYPCGLFGAWFYETRRPQRADLARQIRDLPVKPDWPGKII